MALTLKQILDMSDDEELVDLLYACKYPKRCVATEAL